MEQNQFTEKYKTLSTYQLVAIIYNPVNYQPLAVITAQAELDSRHLSPHEIEIAKNELFNKQLKEQELINQKTQKQQAVTNKALKVLDYANPTTTKTSEKVIIIICVTLLLMFVFKIANSYHSIQITFKYLDFFGLLELTEIVWLPITIYLFWRKLSIGRSMLSIWLIYHLLVNGIFTYYAFKFRDINDVFAGMLTTPSLSACLYGFVFYGGLLYYIHTKKIKQLFNPVAIEEIAEEN